MSVAALARLAALVAACVVSSAGCYGVSVPAADHQNELAIERCAGIAAEDARCYVLHVPENRSAPGRTIPLRIVVLPAVGPSRAPDPVVYLAGGPGQAATSMINADSGAARALRAHRDLVFADQRGTGGSHALDCAFYGPPDDPQSYFSEFLPVSKVRACRAAYERRADLSQYTTSASVDDLESIRVALQYPQLNFIGGSYGTRLAMEYVRRYGPRVRTVVLESVVKPTMHAPDAFGRMAARALDGLLTECATTPHCAAAFPALRQEATQVFDRVRQAPQTAMVAHPSGGAPARVTLTRNHVGEAIRYMLYTSGSASSVPFVLHRAFEGDFEPIAAFLIGWRASGTFDGLYLSITCAEDVPFVAADAAELDEGTFLGGYRVREQRAACAEWPRGRVAPEQFEPVVSDVPVLIFTGGLDPVTPASNGDEVIKTLPNGIHLPIPSAGHSAAGLVGTECISALQAALIERGTTSGLKTDCIRQIRRSGFRTR